MDNYSRYITSMGLYRSQTAAHVLETYRRGIAEYGVPKEMLTDNGRQYTNWRGKTRFEKEMKKDRVKRIAWGWSDTVVTKLSKMIILKKYSKEKWKRFWKQKLGIAGHFSIRFVHAELRPCHNF